MRAKAAPIERQHHRGDEPHLLREIVRTYQVLMAGMSREIGMPASRVTLMRLLAVANSDVGVMDLARQLDVNAAAVTRQVQDLARDGLVRRRSDPKDGRRSYVSLSTKGLAVFEQIHDRSHELERSLSTVLSAKEMESTAKSLAKLRTFVEGLRRGQKGVEP